MNGHRLLPAVRSVPWFCGLLAALLPAPANSQELPLPDTWEVVYVWFLDANPDYQGGSEEEEAAITRGHIQYQLRLQTEDRAIAAGGFDAVEGELVVGMTLLRAVSRADAEATAGADPAVRAGRLVARVREWWVPSGRLR